MVPRCNWWKQIMGQGRYGEPTDANASLKHDEEALHMKLVVLETSLD